MIEVITLTIEHDEWDNPFMGLDTHDNVLYFHYYDADYHLLPANSIR